MKRFVSLLLMFVVFASVCLCLTSCKKDEETVTTVKEETVAELSDQDIRILMEKNLDCYFLFYVAPLAHTTQQNSDGYYGTEKNYLQSYYELEKLVSNTYTNEKSYELLNFPDSSAPLYKNYDGEIFVNPDAITPVDYEIMWEDDYTIEMKKVSDTEYDLSFSTRDFELEPYSTNGKIVFENGNWRFADVIY